MVICTVFYIKTNSRILEYPNENDINWEKLCENWSWLVRY